MAREKEQACAIALGPQAPPTRLGVLQGGRHVVYSTIHILAVTDIELHGPHPVALHVVQVLGAPSPLVLERSGIFSHHQGAAVRHPGYPTDLHT